MSASSIIITQLDLQRLERLLAGLQDVTPGVEALEHELARAKVVAHNKVPAGVVTMNSRVFCRDEGSGKEYHLTLVYPQDAGPSGTVSILAPVGSALLGLRVGDVIDWPMPGGRSARLHVLSIRYQPEAAGELHR